eukprot:TRINITY_DN3942_c1_g1_i1.p1 TRINITY_DN3942_c1_g1~~TRINITY_DN3942_c1_g1_i1.p1  ORF type:complete len:350 (-),score=48.87 TRINITY_DN3942_c1_g1_i1:2682-3731(-)
MGCVPFMPSLLDICLTEHGQNWLRGTSSTTGAPSNEPDNMHSKLFPNESHQEQTGHYQTSGHCGHVCGSLACSHTTLCANQEASCTAGNSGSHARHPMEHDGYNLGNHYNAQKSATSFLRHGKQLEPTIQWNPNMLTGNVHSKAGLMAERQRSEHAEGKLEPRGFRNPRHHEWDPMHISAAMSLREKQQQDSLREGRLESADSRIHELDLMERASGSWRTSYELQQVQQQQQQLVSALEPQESSLPPSASDAPPAVRDEGGDVITSGAPAALSQQHNLQEVAQQLHDPMQGPPSVVQNPAMLPNPLTATLAETAPHPVVVIAAELSALHAEEEQAAKRLKVDDVSGPLP